MFISFLCLRVTYQAVPDIKRRFIHLYMCKSIFFKDSYQLLLTSLCVYEND